MPTASQSSLNLEDNSEEPPSRGKPQASSQSTTPSLSPAPDGPSVIHLALSWVREKMHGRTESSLKDVLEEVLEDDAMDGVSISAEEKNLLTNMMTFGEITVDDIMVPRADIAAIEHTSSVEKIRETAIQTGHTRIPIYRESLDKIEGFVHVKDLLPLNGNNEDFAIDSMIRNILFVPPSMRVLDLLMKMRVSGCHMAIVVDEYGGTDGLATMEDLFEELVGEIQDEHDLEEQQDMMVWASDHVLDADARVPIEMLEETLGERLSEGDIEELEYDTLGGYLFDELGRVPAKGEVVHLRSHIKIEILSADPRRIYRVRITLLAGK